MTADPNTPVLSVVDTLPDRIRLDRRYDVEQLQHDVRAIVSSLTQPTYIYYSPVPLTRDVTTPATQDWAAEPMLKDCSYLHKVFAGFETAITSIRLMRLEAGAELKEHSDPTLDAVHREIVRLTLPVFSESGVDFLLNGTKVPMQPGELWYLKLSEPHSVHNNGATERINMSIDVVWNQWVEDWLAANASQE